MTNGETCKEGVRTLEADLAWRQLRDLEQGPTTSRSLSFPISEGEPDAFLLEFS